MNEYVSDEYVSDEYVSDEQVVDDIHRYTKMNSTASPYARGVQVGSPEPPFKTNDIHSMHVVEVLLLHTSPAHCTFFNDA